MTLLIIGVFLIGAAAGAAIMLAVKVENAVNQAIDDEIEKGLSDADRAWLRSQEIEPPDLRIHY